MAPFDFTKYGLLTKQRKQNQGNVVTDNDPKPVLSSHVDEKVATSSVKELDEEMDTSSMNQLDEKVETSSVNELDEKAEISSVKELGQSQVETLDDTNNSTIDGRCSVLLGGSPKTSGFDARHLTHAQTLPEAQLPGLPLYPNQRWTPQYADWYGARRTKPKVATFHSDQTPLSRQTEKTSLTPRKPPQGVTPISSPVPESSKESISSVEMPRRKPKSGVKDQAKDQDNENVSKFRALSNDLTKVRKPFSIHEQIKQATAVGLRDYNNRLRSKDPTATVSLRDLDLARATVDPLRPKSSKRLWAPDSPLTMPSFLNLYGEIADPFVYSSKPAQSKVNIPISDATEIGGTPQSDMKKGMLATTTSNVFTKGNNRSQWATKEEIECHQTRPDTNSDAWGFAAFSDNDRSNVSSDHQYGRLLHDKDANNLETTLRDWEGKLMPPVEEWGTRPRFNNNNTEFKNFFNEWKAQASRAVFFDNGLPILNLSAEMLSNHDLQPDGISMTSKYTTIDRGNAARYGYENFNNIHNVTNRLTQEDFEDWAKIDPRDFDNARNKNETTEKLVTNWLNHLANARGVLAAPIEKQILPMDSLADLETAMNKRASPVPSIRPKLNVYLRPALKIDIPEMTRIYNWHVKHSARPTETTEISEADMRLRYDAVQSGKLPFIIAVVMSKSSAVAFDLEAEQHNFDQMQENRAVNNVHRKYRAVTRKEKVAGFACAQDLTASDYVEHISAEVELYVDPTYRQQGVGRCLIDKLLEACDRGHVPRSGYQFHCAQEVRHMFGPGGGRDLHKIYFVLRKFTKVKSTVGMPVSKKKTFHGKEQEEDQEDDYECWLKAWLESWGFEVEGLLSRVGAKKGRFLDAVYLGRQSKWQPSDGHVPEPFPGFCMPCDESD